MSNFRYDLALGQPPPHSARAKLLYVSSAKYGGDWQSVPHTHNCTEFFYVVDIQHYLHAMLREVETKAPGYDAVCQNLMDILLIQLMRRVQLGATVASPQGSPSRKAAAARRFIDANYRDNITLDQMAEALHMSKYHLAHIFRLEYGMSPIHYMQSLRLQESRKLLSTTDYSLTQIARMTGFSSPSYFSQRFRAVEGINPGQYRARFRASQGEKSQTKEE